MIPLSPWCLVDHDLVMARHSTIPGWGRVASSPGFMRSTIEALENTEPNVSQMSFFSTGACWVIFWISEFGLFVGMEKSSLYSCFECFRLSWFKSPEARPRLGVMPGDGRAPGGITRVLDGTGCDHYSRHSFNKLEIYGEDVSRWMLAEAGSSVDERRL